MTAAPLPETVGGIIDAAAARLAEAGFANARHEARLLLGVVTGMDESRLMGWPETVCPESEKKSFEKLIVRRLDHEPISHLTGVREFWSLPFSVDKSVLDPRADSEILIEASLRYTAAKKGVIRVLDLGTGSGCLLLSVLHEIEGATGIGTDFSAPALAVAKRNADLLGLSDRAGFIEARWADGIAEAFDLILCNPPYIRSADIETLAPQVNRHEPRTALDGGVDGLDCYREIMPALPSLLKPDGVALFEFGLGQAPDVSDIAARNGLQTLSLENDLADHERCLVLALRDCEEGAQS